MKVLDRVCLDKVDVRRMTEDALARLGIRLINCEEVILQFLNCEETWEPVLDCSGKLRPGYWHCPAGCNRGAEQAGLRFINLDVACS
jgi:hypothetical protein